MVFRRVALCAPLYDLPLALHCVARVGLETQRPSTDTRPLFVESEARPSVGGSHPEHCAKFYR